ncbi:hypothetical protein [Mariniluteicoccus endophyticus]
MPRKQPRLDPRLPLVERSDGLQVGLSPDHGLLLRGDAGTWRTVLSQIDGTRALHTAAARVDMDPTEIHGLVARLEEHELLTPRRRRQPRVRLIGSGALARDLAETLVRTATARLTVVDPDPAPPKVYAAAHATGGESLVAHLRAQGLSAEHEPHWWSTPHTYDLTVVADDHLEPDRALTEVLHRTGTPFLLVRPQPRGLALGPIVVPGRSACVGCLDLVRARDPEWGTVLTELCRTRLPSSAAHRAWACGQLVQVVREGVPVRDTLPPLAGRTLEVDPDWSVEVRSWPRHPACACRVARAA